MKHRRHRRSWVLYLACFFYLTGAIFYLHNIGLESDTGHMVEQVRESLQCIAHGQWVNCTGGGSYPLFQKIPSALLLLGGFKDGLILRVLAALSLCVSVGLGREGFRSLAKRDEGAAWVFLLVLGVGPFLWYARSSFGEALAAFLTMMVVIAFRDGWKISSCWLFLFAAGLSKETAFPFLFAIAAIAIVSRNRDLQRSWISRSDALTLVTASLASIVLNVAHCYFRFGTWQNLSYMDPTHYVPNLATHLNFFLALWLAPNGGMVFFWPTFLAVLVIGWLGALRAKESKVLQGMCAVSLILLTLITGFSKWAYPFGWVGWGPRFVVPWVPALCYLILMLEPRYFSRQLYRLCRNSKASLGVAAVLGFLFFPHASALFNRDVVDWLFLPDEICPKLPVIELDRFYYLGCIRHEAWDHPSVLLKAMDPFFNAQAALLAWIATVGLLHFCVLIRRRMLTLPQ